MVGSASRNGWKFDYLLLGAVRRAWKGHNEPWSCGSLSQLFSAGPFNFDSDFR